MTITDPLLLPPDVLVPVAELPEQVRRQLTYDVAASSAPTCAFTRGASSTATSPQIGERPVARSVG